VARKTGLGISVFAESSGYPILHVFSKSPSDDAPKIYLSAGIHGDEPATTEALLAWCESRPDFARTLNLLIFPCLNPWGLVHNKRSDEEGRDLNRCYRDPLVPQIRKQCELIRTTKHDIAVILHEDYDAQGAYVYETSARRPHLGEKIIEAMSAHIPPDPRSKIDGNRCRNGVIRRRVTQDLMPDWPEAFTLHFSQARRVFTVETASEFHIDARVAAHVAAIDAALSLIR
jgi:predicted deacylase